VLKRCLHGIVRLVKGKREDADLPFCVNVRRRALRADIISFII